MSSVDNRIVEMQFDNKQFESGVQTSVKSLENLKKGLDLSASAKGLSDLDRVGKSFSLAGIAQGVDTIASKFTTLGIMGVTALQNITNSVLNTGKKILSALTVDPIKTGLKEYETKLNAITTILTNTKSKGTTLADVNTALGELNTYADKTIYNFAEMTKNIGTFTAAGVALKPATEAIKGIANLAAGSGSSALQASSAMYQLSQAMASGTVKLMDWNSVVNAGMGGELFQKALEKTAVGLGHGRNMAVSFRESLESGWITTEVLTKTLAQFAQDADLIKAATQVKTFTQLFDTMKESVQSGWAVSWENIIGDRDQAAKTLTGINDAFAALIGPSTDARNAMLKYWNVYGGREALIKAVTNAFAGLGTIIKPISEALKEVFPPMTGKRLVEITNGIRDLTANFKIGDETAANLKRTFKGVFALLDIGKEAFMAIAGGVGSLIKYLLPAGDGLLSFTGSIGDWLVSLDEAIKTSDAFNVAIKKIGDFMKPIADGIKVAVKTIVDVFKSLGDVDMSGISVFSERVKTRFEPFTKIIDIVQKVLSKIGEVLKKFAPGFYVLARIIGNTFGVMSDNIVKAFDNAEFNSIFDIINSGVFVGILVGLRKFIDGLTGLTTGGFLSKIKGILDGVKGSLKAYQDSIKAKTLLTIALAIGILALSLIALSLIDSKKLTSSLAAMSVMFVELFGSMAVFEKIAGGKGFKGMIKVSLAMIGLSIAILILSVALGKLAKLSWKELAKGLGAMAIILAELLGFMKLVDPKNVISTGIGLTILAAGMLIFASAVGTLGNMSLEQLAKGLGAMAIVLAELVGFMKLSDPKKVISTAIGLTILGAAMLIFAQAIGVMGNMSLEQLAKGLGAMAIVLGELVGFMKLSDPKKVISTAIGLTILGAAMLIFAQVVGAFGNMSWEQLGKGLLGMGAALVIVAGAMRLMPNNMILTGTGLVIVAAALVILSKALQSMGGMSWEAIAKGLITLAASLVIIAGAMYLMQSALPGAAALLIVAAALAILAPVLQSLGSMSLAEIGKSMLALAGVFVVLGVAALILAPVVPIILGLAIAIGLLGLGVLAIGGGLLLFSAGLAALAVSGTAGAAALVVIVTAIIGLIPLFLTKVGEGIIAFCTAIAGSTVAIIAAITTVLLALIKAIIVIIPKAVEALVVLLTALIKAIIVIIPKAVEALVVFLTALLDAIITIIPKAIQTMVAFLTALLDAIITIIPKAIETMVVFLTALLDAIITITPKAVETLLVLIQALLDAIVGSVSKMVDAGMQLIAGVLKGIADNIQDVVETGADIIINLLKGIANKLPDVIQAAFDVLISFINGFADAIRDNSDEIFDACANLIDAIIDAIKSLVYKLKDAGKDMIWGLIDGIKSMAKSLAKAAMGVVEDAVDGVKDFLGIDSPSKVFAEIGMYVDEGLAGGLKKFGGLVATEATNVGVTAVDAMKSAVSHISDVISGDLDMTPTIRPVLDLTDIVSGAKTIGSLIDKNQGITVASANNKVSSISKNMQPDSGNSTSTKGPSAQEKSFSFVQNNYSPAALSRLEIYRQTKNQFSAMKRMVTT